MKEATAVGAPASETIEYRIIPVTRHVLTRHVKVEDGAVAPCSMGEFPNLSAAATAGRAFAMHDRWELKSTDREVIFDDPWGRACAYAHQNDLLAPDLRTLDVFFARHPDAAKASWVKPKDVVTAPQASGRPMPMSRFAVGDIVVFQPDLAQINARDGTCSGGAMAKVVGVEFGMGKVYYDLAVADPEEPGEYYEVNPIRRVDSFMVCSQCTDDLHYVIVEQGFEPSTLAYYADSPESAAECAARLRAEHVGKDFRVFSRLR